MMGDGSTGAFPAPARDMVLVSGHPDFVTAAAIVHLTAICSILSFLPPQDWVALPLLGQQHRADSHELQPGV